MGGAWAARCSGMDAGVRIRAGKVSVFGTLANGNRNATKGEDREDHPCTCYGARNVKASRGETAATLCIAIDTPRRTARKRLETPASKGGYGFSASAVCHRNAAAAYAPGGASRNKTWLTEASTRVSNSSTKLATRIRTRLKGERFQDLDNGADESGSHPEKKAAANHGEHRATMAIRYTPTGIDAFDKRR